MAMNLEKQEYKNTATIEDIKKIIHFQIKQTVGLWLKQKKLQQEDFRNQGTRNEVFKNTVCT